MTIMTAVVPLHETIEHGLLLLMMMMLLSPVVQAYCEKHLQHGPSRDSYQTNHCGFFCGHKHNDPGHGQSLS